MLDEGLADCVKNIHPVEFELTPGERVSLFVENITIAEPQVPATCITVRNKKIYPSECRQRASSYTGLCTVTVGWTVNGVPRAPIDKQMGEIPIMLKVSDHFFTWIVHEFDIVFVYCWHTQTKACNLNGKAPKQLVEQGEHENEWGGCFIMKGHEKLIRMLLMTRKNFPITVSRNTWKDRGQNFSDLGIMVRSVRTDQTATVGWTSYFTHSSIRFSIVFYISYVDKRASLHHQWHRQIHVYTSQDILICASYDVVKSAEELLRRIHLPTVDCRIRRRSILRQLHSENVA